MIIFAYHFAYSVEVTAMTFIAKYNHYSTEIKALFVINYCGFMSDHRKYIEEQYDMKICVIARVITVYFTAAVDRIDSINPLFSPPKMAHMNRSDISSLSSHNRHVNLPFGSFQTFYQY